MSEWDEAATIVARAAKESQQRIAARRSEERVFDWRDRWTPELTAWIDRMELWADVVGQLGARGLPLLTPAELDQVLAVDPA